MKSIKTEAFYELDAVKLIETVIPNAQKKAKVGEKDAERQLLEVRDLLEDYIKSKRKKGIKKNSKNIVVDTSNPNLYFGFLCHAVNFLPPVAIPAFLDYQFKLYKDKHTNDSKLYFVLRIKDWIFYHVKNENFKSAKTKLKVIEFWYKEALHKLGHPRDFSGYSPKPTEELRSNIFVNDASLINVIINALTTNFPIDDLELLRKLLSGYKIGKRLTFIGYQSRLTELFLRLYYNEKISGTKTDLVNWIVMNFEYSRNNVVRKFSDKTVHDLVSRNKRRSEPLRKKIIAIPGIEYQTPKQRGKF